MLSLSLSLSLSLRRKPLEHAKHPVSFLTDATSHPNDRYWLLKTICLNNLFGLDLMGEAAEIAKLRLFLKLVAQLDNVSQIEPLPDLDFNIKSGNLLVGIADRGDAERRFGTVLGLHPAEQAAKRAADAYDEFASAQLSGTAGVGVVGKQRLISQIGHVTGLADIALFDMCPDRYFDSWRNSHSPFHWFAEFPSVWRHGGFDVIVGNPPYVRTKAVTEYTWRGYTTQKCPDLYAVCVERASMLLNYHGRMAMIVMHSLCFNKGFAPLRKHLTGHFPSLWVSSYSRIPDGLFSGSARVRNTIVVAGHSGKVGFLASRCLRWLKEKRPSLFAGLEYTQPEANLMSCGRTEQWPFVDSDVVSSAFARMVRGRPPLEDVLAKRSNIELGYKKVAHYMLGVYPSPPPIIDSEGRVTVSPHNGWFYFESEDHRDLVLMVLAGRWAYLWWAMFGDDFNVTRSLLSAVPCDIEGLLYASPCDMEVESIVSRLLELAGILKREMPKHLAWKMNSGIKVGRYNMRKLRYITDEADLLLARAWGIENAYEAAGNLRDRMTFGSRD